MNRKKRPLFLISNDDGYYTRGIKYLLDLAAEFGDVLVVAPDKGHSGMSHAVTLSECIRIQKRHEEEGKTIYSCSGTPADCIKIALNQIMGDRKPDFILSGINHGCNSSVSMVYSGTMAAVIEGCMNGIPSVGFSVDDHSMDADFDASICYGRKIIKELVDKGLPENVCLNVNFPKTPLSEVKGMKVCRQTPGVWKEEFEKRTDPRGKDYYWLTGEFKNLDPKAEDTDDHALQNNFGAIVPVRIDWTSKLGLEAISKWDFR